MSQQVLEKLFDSPAKLRLLKLFLRNSEIKFLLSDIRKRTLLDSSSVRRQLKKLEDIRFVTSVKKRNSSERIYSLNNRFVFFDELQNLILKSSPADENKLSTQIRGLGRVKLAILSGIFLKPDRQNSRCDMLVVCDDIRERKFANFIRNLEAESGIELNYTILTSEEFDYRYKMFDRFVHDILEKPHIKLINKILK